MCVYTYIYIYIYIGAFCCECQLQRVDSGGGGSTLEVLNNPGIRKDPAPQHDSMTEIFVSKLVPYWHITKNVKSFSLFRKTRRIMFNNGLGKVQAAQNWILELDTNPETYFHGSLQKNTLLLLGLNPKSEALNCVGFVALIP